MNANDLITKIAEQWFLTEPALFRIYCGQDLSENRQMKCLVRCGKGKVEYNPDLMADTAVLLFVEVALQIAFCIRHAFPERQEGSRISRWLYLGLKGFPGLLYLVVFFSLQVQLIFMLPGVSFPLVSWSLAAAVSVFIVLGIWAMRRLVPEEELRLELLFLANAVIAALGVIATVNGRTAANFLTT